MSAHSLLATGLVGKAAALVDNVTGLTFATIDWWAGSIAGGGCSGAEPRRCPLESHLNPEEVAALLQWLADFGVGLEVF